LASSDRACCRPVVQPRRVRRMSFMRSTT
jgi:hypothetical protein